MKRIFSILICLTLFLSVFAACGTAKTANESQTSTSVAQAESTVAEKPAEPVSLHFMGFGPQYNDQMTEMIAEYKKFAPNVSINFEMIANDYWTVLKSKFASGEVPDTFWTYAYKDNKVYGDYLYDCTNEPWVSSVDEKFLPGSSLDGKVLGYPFILQGYGLIYDKKAFADAGITELPKNIKELEDACKKLKEKNITAFGTGYKDWWILQQVFANFLSKEVADAGGDFNKFFDEISNGTKKFSDFKRMTELFNFLDLTVKYGDSKPLETDFNGQMSLLGTGKVAMIHNGTWAEVGTVKVNKDIQLGFLGEPTGDDQAKLMVDSNVVWRISKDGKNLEESKKFMNWIVTSDYGKSFAPTKIGEMSTVKGAPGPTAQLATDALNFISAGNTLPWLNAAYPDGFEAQMGQVLQEYVAKTKTREQSLDEMTKIWVKTAKTAK